MIYILCITLTPWDKRMLLQAIFMKIDTMINYKLLRQQATQKWFDVLFMKKKKIV